MLHKTYALHIYKLFMLLHVCLDLRQLKTLASLIWAIFVKSAKSLDATAELSFEVEAGVFE